MVKYVFYITLFNVIFSHSLLAMKEDNDKVKNKSENYYREGNGFYNKKDYAHALFWY